MVLLVYHFDKNNSLIEEFLNQPIRLDLGFFPKQNTYIKLRQVGFSCNARGGTMHVDFPDCLPSFISEEKLDFSDTWEKPGFDFICNYGENGISGAGNYEGQSTHIDTNLNLGNMDTQKDFFTVVVNGRRATENQSTNLNSVSFVFEMSHQNRHT